MMVQVSARVHFLPHDDHADRPVLGHICGDRYALMVDAGNSAAHVALYNDALRAVGLPPPDFVALTHWHWDHTFGLHAVGCPSIATEQTNRYLADVRRWAWSDAAMAERLRTGEDNDFCDRAIRIEYPNRARIVVRQADIAFTNVLTLDLGGITCELRQIDNPHTADGVILYLPQEGLVFLGDADCEGHHHGRSPLYREKLAALHASMERLDFSVCIPGHGAPLSKAALLAEWRAELDA